MAAKVLCSRRVPWVVMVRPRQPREARSGTAQARDKQEPAGQPADHRDPSAGLPEGAFDEVGVPGAVWWCSAGNRR